MHVQTNNYITNLDINFKSETLTPNGYKNTLKLGKAFVQILNFQPVAMSVFEYIQSINNYPQDKHQYLNQLLTALDVADLSQLNIGGRVAILHHLEIFESYKGKNLSKLFIWFILKAIKENEKIEHVLLQACPIGIDWKETVKVQRELGRLEKLYGNVGFKLLQNRKPLERDGIPVHYMYMNLAGKTFDKIDVY